MIELIYIVLLTLGLFLLYQGSLLAIDSLESDVAPQAQVHPINAYTIAGALVSLGAFLLLILA